MALERFVEGAMLLEDGLQEIESDGAGRKTGRACGRRAAHPQGPRAAAERGAATLALAPMRAAISCRRRMRSSVLGWVENRLSSERPCSGLMMKRCAVAGLASAAGLSMR